METCLARITEDISAFYTDDNKKRQRKYFVSIFFFIEGRTSLNIKNHLP